MNLLQQADIPNNQKLVADILNTSIQIALKFNKNIQEFVPSLYSSFKRSNEMSINPYSTEQIIDILKININTIKLLQDILKNDHPSL